MLAETREQPFTKAGWLFELKLDGYRLRAARRRARPASFRATATISPSRFPEIARAVAALARTIDVILDGEVVVLDDARPPQLPAAAEARPADPPTRRSRRAAVELPATLTCSICSTFGGYDLRPLPLLERKALLEKILPPAGAASLPRALRNERRGPVRAGGAARARGHRREEVPTRPTAPDARRTGSRSGPTEPATSWWWDTRARRDRAAASARCSSGLCATASSLYAGRAGSGFNAAQLKGVTAAARACARGRRPPFSGPVPRDDAHTWVEPELVVEVRYKEWTDEGLLRQPVFLSFATTSRSTECELPGRGTGTRERRRARGADAPRPASRSPRSQVFQSRQGLLARGRLHEGRPHRRTTARSRPGCCPI